MSSESSFYTGSWTFWEDGSIYGPRITLTNTHASYLVAFLALFVRLAGQHSWDILSFVCFRLKRSSKRKDDVYRGQQVIFRNTPSDAGAVWQFIKLGFGLRVKKSSFLQRSLLFICLAAFHLLAFAAAGVFVSRVTITGPQVLVRGSTCGIFSPSRESSQLEDMQWAAWLDQTTFSASRLAQQCYNSSSKALPSNCAAFGPRLLPFNVTTAVDCPFEARMCSNKTVRFESGTLDSQLHFGVNTEPKDRVKYRRVVECAPVTQDGFASGTLDYNQAHIPEVPPGQQTNYLDIETYQ
ncbi:hypothetical protein H2200_007697 [Cladophialophora chaetospira]|uniref:Uncharacterized protein n=1 Tax=Cladophialophora chaetospira TaxID=386627 RepID=A0AA39CGN5_9EURO|nr:hypothetical protein H2200_007697 [Cladophialophora chaetospira]